MALRTEQKLPIILFVVFLTLTTIGILFFQSTESLKQARELDRRSIEFQYKADQLLTLCLDAENAARGFMFTGVDTYLGPYQRAKTQIPANLAELREFSAKDPALEDGVSKLSSAVTSLQQEIDRKIDQRKILGYSDELLKEIYVLEDRPRMEAIRTFTQQIKAIETVRQQRRDSQMDQGLSRTVWILIVSSAAGIISLALANFVVFRAIKKRQSAETALSEVNRGLEERIAQRTQELEVMNRRLREIGDERELLLRQESSSRKEAEIANRLRDEFMATVSHELRTPLNSILGWARLMKEGGLNHEQSERAVATIIKNSETQNRLIEDLLDVARLISGKLELDLTRLDLAESVAESIEIAQPSAAARRIRIHFDKGSGHASVLGDRDRLRQVFSNLLNNAIKFSHEGGDVNVSVDSVAGRAKVIVRDTGTGISKDFLPLVFERFRQSVASNVKNGGLGLGLAIVRNLAEMHGGSVSVSSDGIETGAVFTVELPLSESQVSV